jgi:CRISPR-associated protein Cas1
MGRLESNPIMMKERASMVWLSCGNVEIIDGALALVDKDGIRIQVPVGGLACIFLEPGVRITHEAVVMAAEAGCLILWVGEGGTRMYSAGQPGGARADRLLYQARLALEDEPRLKVVRAMYRMRFGEEPPARRSVDQLRGIEGVRVRTMYQELAKQYGIIWQRRDYDRKDFNAGDEANRCLSVANHCLYGICEAAILAAGYAPAIGFLHTGKPLSFVYDIADLFKFNIAVPIAFKVVATKSIFDKIKETRLYCRNSFRKHSLLERIIPAIEEVLSAGGISKTEPHSEAVVNVIPNEDATGDVGHRN